MVDKVVALNRNYRHPTDPAVQALGREDLLEAIT
jgi:hypothetical protein